MTVYLRAHVKGVGTVHNVAEPFQFPGGEWHLKNLTDHGGGDVSFIADVRGASLDDLVVASLLANVAAYRGSRFVLMLPYLPAARADRGEPFGVGVYGQLVNAMNADQVIGIDPHSPVVTRVIVHLTALDPYPLVKQALHDDKYDAVIAPDAGASMRATDVAMKLGVDFYIVKKHRDFETGKILDIDVPDIPLKGKYLVVDDICDGGGTFMMLANALELPREQLGLWVTHGIFSGAANGLQAHYRHIYTTDSHPGHNRVGCATSIVPTYVYMQQNTGLK